ncbi:MAG TPA: 4Fe-4S binding protein [Streptosporangiaceae bacterium]|nr:4Fe-4S binding protein [Streptosporangiaceae bacterium]
MSDENVAPGGEAGLPARSRGVIGLLEENCTICMLCARECPDWCIYIDSHKEPVPVAEPDRSSGGEPMLPAGRARQRVRNVLDRFAIDFSLCMYCGICIEVCPYDALFWSPEFSYAETDIADLTHERGKLREWMQTVPAPPHDRGAPPAREAIVSRGGAKAANLDVDGDVDGTSAEVDEL